jgi:demethylmenaquinone methyltransferase/2-methoxy-6-polyprenyl-1,4-benzoquinol methylase
MKTLPKLAKRTSSNPSAYVYLAESIRAWPNQEQLASQMILAGWSKISWCNLAGGIVSVHQGTKSKK